MKRSHASFWVGFAAFYLAAMYSVILFLVKPHLDLTSWVLYGATMIAFFLVGIQMIAIARGGSFVITDTALGIVTAIYFFLQLIFGGIVCMSFRDVPMTPVLVGEIILLAVYLVIAFFIYAAQSSNDAQDHNDRQAVQKMRLLENDVQGMMENIEDPAVKKALADLAETIHYCDIISLPGLADVEDRIAQNIVVLQEDLTDDSADPLSRIETLKRLLRERDRTAAILKK